MNGIFSNRMKRVAVGRLASSSLSPRVTLLVTLRLSSRHTPRPFPSASSHDAPDALLGGLPCFKAFRPLRLQNLFRGEGFGSN